MPAESAQTLPDGSKAAADDSQKQHGPWFLRKEREDAFLGFVSTGIPVENTSRTGCIRWNSFDQIGFNGKSSLISP